MTTAADAHRYVRHTRRIPPCPARRRIKPEEDWPHFTQLVAEVLAGHRNPDHLRWGLSEDAYRSLQGQAGCFAMRQRPRLRHVWMEAYEPGVTEINGVVRYGERRHALALRVIHADYRWLCTDIETASR
ncbi:hypothetical protein TM51_09066 [Thermobifida fusca TM51]|uniref:Uncharacterized protein n=1 Tax=Thermobifida fusca TM51 TaxID=1169414 RepID=A0A9P2T9J1_THEFU|nr:Rv3235 family protein [Thermobifida fusca]EOR71139.1 hypothetical protein TM51_09066 [Thermobifida fusca TM51]